MKRIISFLLLLAAELLPGSGLTNCSADWLTMPSRYSHDVVTGQRVAQFAPQELPTTAVAQPLRSSGYTHYRSSLAYGQSADNYHKVQQWGDPVRPYGEWRFPYRPYSTPYPNWGAPYAGLSFNNNFIGGAGGGYPARPRRHGPGGQRPNPAAGTNRFAPYPAGRGTPYPVAPYYDGYHPNYRD